MGMSVPWPLGRQGKADPSDWLMSPGLSGLMLVYGDQEDSLSSAVGPQVTVGLILDSKTQK